MRPSARWAAAALYAACIFALSCVKGFPNVAPGIPGIDKAAHFVVYLPFAAVVWWALRGSGAGRWAAMLAALIVSAYGVTDEVHQYYVPGRSMEFLDWLADAAAGFAWAGIVWLRARRAATPPR